MCVRRLGDNLLFVFFLLLAGVRVVDANRHAGDAVGGIGDGPCVHLCHTKAAADDHFGGGQGAHPDVPQQSRSTRGRFRRRSTHVRHRLRGDGAHLQHQRRWFESKANGIRFATCACARALARRSALFAPRAEPPGGAGRVSAACRLLAGVP